MHAEKYVCIRDDDTNFHTRLEDLSESYGEFWDEVPITLAVIPFVHGSESAILGCEQFSGSKYEYIRLWEEKASVKELGEYHKLWPVGENVALVEALKPMIQTGKIEIAQHGVSHRYDSYGAEMYCDNVGLSMIEAGKKYLSKVFDTEVTVFVPPSNTIDPCCARYLEQIGLDLLTSGSLCYRTKREKLLETVRFPLDLFRIMKETSTTIGPMMRKRKGVMLFSSLTFGLGRSAEDFYQLVLQNLDKNRAVSIATHYRTLRDNPPYREEFRKLLSLLKGNTELEFVSASAYIDLLKKN